MTEVCSTGESSPGTSPRRDRSEDWSERWLHVLDPSTSVGIAGMRHLVVMLCFHVGCRHVHLAIRMQEPLFVLSGGIAWAVAFGCLVERRSERLGRWPLLLVVTVLVFGYAKTALGNHAAMESLVLLAIALATPITTPRLHALAGLFRWCCVILFLNSGLQKVFYGAYFNGSFLARRIASDHFGWVLELGLPAEEVLALLEANRAGAMVLSSVQGLLLSNAVYLTEIGCALLLLIPRTRGIGFTVSVATVVGIEVVAREIGFGLMFIVLLLLFRPGLLERRAILALPIAAHAVFGVAEIAWPGGLLW